jgi:formamidopyrimidine-DNA glycosylase
MSRSQTLSPAIGRRTTRSLDPREKLWVYGERQEVPPLRGADSLEKTGLDARLTYWCPACQPPHPH